MNSKPSAPQNIDEYIAASSPAVQAILKKIRQTVRKAAPNAEETIRYDMPTFTLNGSNLVYFAAFKKHIAFYPAPIGIPEFKEALAAYGSGQGTLKFPLDQPIPYDLITKLVKFRARQNLAGAVAKGKRRY